MKTDQIFRSCIDFAELISDCDKFHQEEQSCVSAHLNENDNSWYQCYAKHRDEIAFAKITGIYVMFVLFVCLFI